MDREHCVSAPGGNIEKNESPIVAGFREFYEECNNEINLNDVIPDMWFSFVNGGTKIFVITLNKTPDFKYGYKKINETVFSGFTALKDFIEYEKQAASTLFPSKTLYCATDIESYLIFKDSTNTLSSCVCKYRNSNCNYPQYSYMNGNISTKLLAFSRRSKKPCKCCLCINIIFNKNFFPGRYKELYGCSTFYKNSIPEECYTAIYF